MRLVVAQVEAGVCYPVRATEHGRTGWSGSYAGVDRVAVPGYLAKPDPPQQWNNPLGVRHPSVSYGWRLSSFQAPVLTAETNQRTH